MSDAQDLFEDADPIFPQDSATRRQSQQYNTRHPQSPVSDQQHPGQISACQEPITGRTFQTQHASPIQGAEGVSYLLSSLNLESPSTVSQGESGEHESFKKSEPSSKQKIPSESESNSVPSLLDITDEDIIKYKPKMLDKHLKVDFYDAMILFEDGDKGEVSRFLKLIESEVILERDEKPKVILYDEIDPAMPRITSLDFSLKRCTYVLLYVTKSFCRDGWTEFSSQTCLMEAIHNKEKKWSVVPISTESRQKSTYEVPPSIRSLRNIEYWRDDRSYVDNLRKLFQDRLEVRKEAEERLKYDRQKWVYEKKHEEAREAEVKEMDIKRTQLIQRDREREHKRAMLEKEREQEKCRPVHYFSPDVAYLLGYGPRYGMQDADLSPRMSQMRASHPSIVSAQPYDMLGIQHTSMVPQQGSFPSSSGAGQFPPAHDGMHAPRSQGISHPPSLPDLISQSQERGYGLHKSSRSCQSLPALTCQSQKSNSQGDTSSQSIPSSGSSSLLRSQLSDDYKQDLSARVQDEQQIAYRTDDTSRHQGTNQTLTPSEHFAAIPGKIFREEGDKRSMGVLPSGTTNCHQQFEEGSEKIGCESLKESDIEEDIPPLSVTSRNIK